MDITSNCTCPEHCECNHENGETCGDICVKFASSNNLCRLAGTIKKMTQYNTPPEYLDECFEKLNTLEEEWHSTQMKYQRLLSEYERTQSLLENERSTTISLNKKLKFIRDNQKNFDILRKAFLNMKETGNVPRMVSSDNKVVQSECKAIYPAENFKEDIHNAQETLQKLKNLINTREESWSTNASTNQKLKNEINNLKMENSLLQNMLHGKESQLRSLQTNKEQIMEKKREADCLKKILQKMYIKLKQYELSVGKSSSITLADDEKALLQKLIDDNKKAEQRRSNSPQSKQGFKRSSCSQDNLKKPVVIKDADRKLSVSSITSRKGNPSSKTQPEIKPKSTAKSFYTKFKY